MAMKPEEIRTRYAKMKRRTIRLWLCWIASAGVLLLLVWRYENRDQPGWFTSLTFLLLAAILGLSAALFFTHRCPCCGMPFRSRMRLSQPEYWFHWVFPRKCWYCHTDFETGRADPKQDLRWRGVSTK